MKIKSLSPQMGLPGGVIRIEIEGLQNPLGVKVEVGETQAEILGASPGALTVRIPPECGEGVTVHNDGSDRAPFKIGHVVVSDLHPVANPVVDSLGNVYVTFSGARSEKVPFSVFAISADGSRHPFLADITNPTGLAIGLDHCLYITSRHTGVVYRSTFDKQVEKYVEGLGLATGLAFDSKGNLLVGDRSGMIYKVTPERELSVFCELEPSVSAYHLAIDDQDTLYVTGPTLATQDSVYRVSPEGEIEVFFKGLGRPQGVGFDLRGNLQVVASYRGKKGLYSFQNGTPELMVAGPMLVGFAYNEERDWLYLVDNSNLYRIELKGGH